MKKLLFILLLFMACNIPAGYSPCYITYKVSGNVTDIVIQENTYAGKDTFKTYNNWIGDFSYTFTLENAQNVYISVTNKAAGDIVAAIYKDGYLLQYAVDPVFVEITRVIE